MRILIEPRRSLRATRGARGARGQAWLRLCPFRVLQNEWSELEHSHSRQVRLYLPTAVESPVAAAAAASVAPGARVPSSADAW